MNELFSKNRVWKIEKKTGNGKIYVENGSLGRKNESKGENLISKNYLKDLEI